MDVIPVLAMRLSVRIYLILASCVFAAMMIVVIAGLVDSLYRRPTQLSLGSSPSCPTGAIGLGVQKILDDPIQKEQAIKVLLWAETTNSVDGVPPASSDNLVRWLRQKNLLETMGGRELAGFLCQGPIVNIAGKRLAGVASVAIEHLDKPVEQVTSKEAFLSACAVIGANQEARGSLKLSPAATLESLEKLCPQYRE